MVFGFDLSGFGLGFGNGLVGRRPLGALSFLFFFLPLFDRTLALAAAAFRAISDLRVLESVFARCFPPLLPKVRAISESSLSTIV